MTTSPLRPSLETPQHCIADICLIPIGTGKPSVSAEIAAVTRLFRQAEADGVGGASEGGDEGNAKGGDGDVKGRVKCTMHSAGTTFEGSWDTVMRLIGQAHALLHQNGVVRVQSDIRVGTRTDKSQTAEQKVEAVQRILQDGQ